MERVTVRRHVAWCLNDFLKIAEIQLKIDISSLGW